MNPALPFLAGCICLAMALRKPLGRYLRWLRSDSLWPVLLFFVLFNFAALIGTSYGAYRNGEVTSAYVGEMVIVATLGNVVLVGILSISLAAKNAYDRFRLEGLKVGARGGRLDECPYGLRAGGVRQAIRRTAWVRGYKQAIQWDADLADRILRNMSKEKNKRGGS